MGVIYLNREWILIEEIMRKSIFIISLLFGALAFGQTNNTLVTRLLSEGDDHFRNGQYMNALRFYKQALEENENSIKAKYQIGECYRLVQDYESAGYYYELIAQEQDVRYPLGTYYYALMQKLKGRYDAALKSFKEFNDFMVSYGLHEDEKNRYFYKQAKVEIDGCQLALNQITMVHTDYQFNPLAAPLNTVYNDYAAFSVWDDDILCLTSARGSGKNSLTDLQFGESYTDIFRFSRNPSGQWEEYDPKDRFENVINTKFGDGPGTFNRDRTKFYYTNCDEDLNGVCHIYVSTLSGGKWSAPIALNHNINEVDYSSKHPSLTPGGDTLFFASDRKGGLGGLDIWMSLNAGGDNWGPAIHLGNQINTPLNELSPFYDQRDQVLFFASDGHRGFGGFDIYIARGTKFESAEIYNAGMPFNSYRNDFFFFLGSKKGFLSSDREDEGMGKFDIYGFDIQSSSNIISEVSSEGTIAGRNSLFTDDYNFDNSETEIINQIISRMLSSSVSDVNLILTERQLAVYNSLSIDDKERIDRIVSARIRKMTSNMIRSIRSEDDYYYQQLDSDKRRKVDDIVASYLEQQGMGNSVSLSNDVFDFYNEVGSEEREKIDILVSDRLKNAEDFQPASPNYNAFDEKEQQSLDGIALKYLRQKRNISSLTSSLDINEKVFVRDQQGDLEDASKAIRERLIGLSNEEKYRLVKEDTEFYETLTQEEKDQLKAIATTFMVSDLTSFDQNVDNSSLDLYKGKNSREQGTLDRLVLRQIASLANKSLYLTEAAFTQDELQSAFSDDPNETLNNLLKIRPDLSDEQRNALEVFVKTTYDSYMVEPDKVFFEPAPVISSPGASTGDPTARLSASDLDQYNALPNNKKRAIDNSIGLDYLAAKYYNRALKLRDEADAKRLPSMERIHVVMLSKKVSGKEIKPGERSYLSAAFNHYNNLSEGAKSFYNRVVLGKAFEIKNGSYVLNEQDTRARAQLTASERSLMERIKKFRFNNERILTENLAVEAKDVDDEPVDIIALAAQAKEEEEANRSDQIMTTSDILASEEEGEVRIELPIDKIDGYSEITITGRLVGESTKNPLRSYSITLVGYDEDATVVEGYTDVNGNFDFTVAPSKYDITFKKASANEGVELARFNVEGKRRKSTEIMVTATRAFFDVNSFALRPEVMILLDEVATAFRISGNKIEIESHTDDTGTLEYNLQLSKDRGYAARDYLISKGIDVSKISVIWHGAGKPIADNGNPYGRQINRRIDVRLLGRSEKDFGNFYLVRPGATVNKLAASFGLSDENIRSINGIRGDLKAYQPVRVKARRTEPDYNLVVPADISSGKDFIYTVKPGDDLSKVAQKFNVPEELLMEQNNLSSTTLEPGTRLIIYPKK